MCSEYIWYEHIFPTWLICWKHCTMVSLIWFWFNDESMWIMSRHLYRNVISLIYVQSIKKLADLDVMRALSSQQSAPLAPLGPRVKCSLNSTCLLNDQLILLENVFFFLFFIILNEIFTPHVKAPIECVQTCEMSHTVFLFRCVYGIPFDRIAFSQTKYFCLSPQLSYC